MSVSTNDRALTIEPPFAILVEIIVAQDPDPIALRITNSKTSVFFGESSAGDPLEYLPAPVSISPIEASASGSLPQFTLEVGTTRDVVVDLLEDHDWLQGAKANVRIVNTGNLADTNAQRLWVLQVNSVELAGNGLRVTLGTYNVSTAQNPPKRYSRHVCGHEYGSENCGAPIDNASFFALFPTCARSLGGSNGCIAHGEGEASLSLPVLHPLRFGARHGIPSERRLDR